MIKKLTYIVVVGFLAVLVYAGLKYYKPTGNYNEPVNPKSQIQVTPEAAISPINSFDNDSIWYATSEGKIYKTGFSNLFQNTEYPLKELIKELQEVYWNKNSPDFIAKQTKNKTTIYSYFDSNTKAIKVLPLNVVNFDWMPDGKRIALVWQSNDKKAVQLVISNSDATGYKVITGLPESDMSIKVRPDGKYALLVSNAQKSIYLYNLQDGSNRKLKIEGETRDAKWVDDDRLLFEKKEGLAISLWAYFLSTDAEKKLADNITLRSTVVNPRQTYVYGAVKERDSDEKIVRINLKTYTIEGFYASKDLHVNELYLFGGYVFFQDSNNGKLYRLE